MSIAKEFPIVDKFFMQECPLCGASQRMMIRGLYIDPKDGTGKLYPDMGYSFCNCRDIFFTRPENLNFWDENFNNSIDPLTKLKSAYDETIPGTKILITLRDPYFVRWDRPHEYTGFNPRRIFILWDTESFIKECEKVGFQLISWKRDMDVHSKTPECSHINLRRPK